VLRNIRKYSLLLPQHLPQKKASAAAAAAQMHMQIRFFSKSRTFPYLHASAA